MLIANVLDFKPLLKLNVQVVRQKQEPATCFGLRVVIPCEHQILVSESEAQVTELEVKAKVKSKPETL